VEAHGEDLRAQVGDDALVAAIKADYRKATGIDPATRALLDFAARMTREPTSLAAADLERLRALGYDDRSILDAAHITGFFNHINRVADALGVDLEDFMPRPALPPSPPPPPPSSRR
jgi:uncharacterized peroxidase-related enzyme